MKEDQVIHVDTLLMQAAAKYPKGTKFLSQCYPDRTLFISEGIFKYEEARLGLNKLPYNVIWRVGPAGGIMGFVWADGIWAEIVEKSEFIYLN